jgi:S1-C subfamily serine protease
MGETLPFAIEAIRPSVIQILVDTGSSAEVAGTGFLVHGEGYALTAKHVTEGVAGVLARAPGSRMMAGLAMPNVDIPGRASMRANFELVQCETVEEDARHDLALLKLSPNPFVSGRPGGISRTPEGGLAINALYGLAPLTLDRPRDGAAIAVSGYPLSQPTLITTSGAIASAWGTDRRDVVPPGAPDGFAVPDFADSYVADVAVNPGNSGGPVYFAASGLVIGVCVAFLGVPSGVDPGGMPLRYNSGLSFVVPIRYAVDLLRRHAQLGGSAT